MAIINNTRDFLFIHVPKAAGTSVTEYYSQLSTVFDVELGGTKMGESLQEFYQRRYGVSKHSTARRFREVLGGSRFDRYFEFCFVRNPYARTVSTFRFLEHWLPESKAYCDAEILESLHSVMDMVESDYWATPGVDNLFLPQSNWIGTGSGQSLVDYVGKVETIDSDIRNINQFIGAELPVFLRAFEQKS